MPHYVSKARFGELVERAISELPPQFRQFLEEVPVQVETRPSRKLMRSLGMDEDDWLFGLYQGADLLSRSEIEGRGTPTPNRILIFQEDHEENCDSEEQLVREIRTTVLHEVGHHFGMDEDDLERLGYA